MTYFLWGKGYRSSCYSCRYAGEVRPGDFTLADFWNNERMNFPIDTGNGASLVLFNTEKAHTLLPVFERNGVTVAVHSVEEAVGPTGGHLRHPSKSDIRTDLIQLSYKFFGITGPKLLFTLNEAIIFLLNGCRRK